jgi:Leucine-rich repeat (LRR) protein
MPKVSANEQLEKLKLMFLSGDSHQIELAFMLAESNDLDLKPIESGIKSILSVSEIKPRLGDWTNAPLENLIYPLKMVLTLCIDDCQMKELPAEIGFFRNLGIVELHGIGLEQLGDGIQYLSKLRSLSTKNNRVEYLPESIGQLKKLRSLNLHDNLLKKLPDALQGLEELELLQLSKNPELKELPAWLCRLPSLKKLILDKDVFQEKVPTYLLPLPEYLEIEWEQIQPKFK